MEGKSYYTRQHLNYLVVLIMIISCFIAVGNSEEEEEYDTFAVGPLGKPCIGSANKKVYDHIDKYGLQCQCTACGPGERLTSDCGKCQLYSNLPQPSECQPLPDGQMLSADYHTCHQGYPCKKCEFPLKVVSKCEPDGTPDGAGDTVCACIEGYEQIEPDVCSGELRCNSSYESQRRFAKDSSPEYECVICRAGYYQPKDNTTDRCTPHRSCVVRSGTKSSDIVCLNDSSQPEHPPEEYMFSTPPATTTEETYTEVVIHQMTSNPVSPSEEPTPASATESTTAATANENTTSQGDTPPSCNSKDSYNNMYLLATHIVVFICGIAVGKYKQLRMVFRKNSVHNTGNNDTVETTAKDIRLRSGGAMGDGRNMNQTRV